MPPAGYGSDLRFVVDTCILAYKSPEETKVAAEIQQQVIAALTERQVSPRVTRDDSTSSTSSRT